KRNTATWGTTDNSNTQFAILAVLAAQRNGVPVDRALRLITRRFSTAQNPDGSWSYDYKHGGGLPEGVAMNCVGLLGMALVHGLAQDVRERLASDGTLHAAGAVAAPTFTNVAAAIYQINQFQEEFEAKKKAAKDDRIVKGFVALNRHVGQPAGQWNDRPMV